MKNLRETDDIDEPENSDGQKDLTSEIADLAPWFHNLHLPGGIETAPDHGLGDYPAFKWRALAPMIPDDLRGWSALDIGCNAGFYTFELAKRGARVVGIDSDEHYLNQARWAAGQFGFTIRQAEFRKMQVYDLARLDETFDIVLFMGVFYHLRYPMLALDIISQKVQRLLVFQTLMMPGEEVYEDTHDRELNDRQALRDPGWPKMAFIEHCLADDPTNWWVPNRAGVEAMLRSSGMRILGRPEKEIFVCEPDPTRPSSISTWNRAELFSATGQERQDTPSSMKK